MREREREEQRSAPRFLTPIELILKSNQLTTLNNNKLKNQRKSPEWAAAI
jgi:hypothetical protein